MIDYNSLVINGKSTADLPFFVAVEEVPGLTKAQKKDKLYKLDHVNGAVKQSIDAWETVPHKFKFYLHEANRSDLREFKRFIGYEGYFVRYDDPSIHINFLSAIVSSEPLDEFDGYEVEVEFECEPFEYEEEREVDITSQTEITNDTTAPMYPKVVVEAASASPMYLSIGHQQLSFPKGLNGKYEIECKHGQQNITNLTTGELANDIARGPFYEIQPGSCAIQKSAGFTSIKMTTRWGWL